MIWFSSRIALICACFLGGLSADISHAETIRVRGGEHDGFSRLAFDLPHSLEWNKVEEARKLDLIFHGSDLTFDLSNALRRLNADRIQSIEPGSNAGALVIGLNCNCKTEIFFFNEKMLVVDILDSDADESFNTKYRHTVLTNKNREFLEFYFLNNMKHVFHKKPNSGITKLLDEIEELPEKADKRENITDPLPEKVLKKKKKKQAYRDQSFEQAIPIGSKTGLFDVFDLTIKSAIQNAEQVHPSGLNFEIRNEAREGSFRRANSSTTGPDPDLCLEKQDLNISRWGKNGSFLESVGNLRSGLYGEFDRPNKENALDLSKLYIFYGFGAEAISILDAFEIDSDHLRNIASLIEGGTIDGMAAFLDALSCRNESVLWSVMSHDVDEIQEKFDVPALLKAFERLPATVRSRVAPGLVERLRALKLNDDAKEVLRLAARGGTGADDGSELATALLIKDEGHEEDATAILSELTDRNVETSPRAMIELVSFKMEADEEIDPSVAQMADILLHEYAGSEIFPDLYFARVVSLVLSGAYTEALGELDALGNIVDPEKFRRAREFLYDRISKRAADSVFLTAALDLPFDVLNALSVGISVKIGQRLLDLGFPTEAIHLLGSDFRGHMRQDSKLIRAQAQLQLRNPVAAEAELIGVEGDSSDRVRAEASVLKRDFETALQLFRKIADQERVDSLEEFLPQTSGDVPGDDVAGAVNPASSLEVPRTEAKDGVTLEGSRKVLEQSERTRGRVAAILGGALFE